MRALAPATLVIAFAILGLTGCAEPAATDDTSQGSGTEAGDTDETAPDTDDATGGCTDPVLVDGPGAVTITITADAMDPSSVDIAVGDVVEFVGAGEGYHGLLVGSLSSVTVTPSLPEYYRFDAAGTCEASDELGSGTATINVG